MYLHNENWYVTIVIWSFLSIALYVASWKDMRICSDFFLLWEGKYIVLLQTLNFLFHFVVSFEDVT